MEYITTKEASAKWGISTTRITVLANEGRIPGAQRLGRSWLIPASAIKPPELKANQSKSNNINNNTNSFSFSLYHFRSDWNPAMAEGFLGQKKQLVEAEKAVLECRFLDGYTLLESIIRSPEDISTEIGALWYAGLCCIALNKTNDFSKIYLRLQMILSKDFPNRKNYIIVLDILKTYVESIGSTAQSDKYYLDVHDQCLPLMCLYVGYTNLTREAMKPKTADLQLLELNLRFLKTTGAVVAMEMMHCHLLGIYYMRHDSVEAERHAKEIVKIAYENQLYFPLVTYYRYFTPVLSPVLETYPEEFQTRCNEMISEYIENFNEFFKNFSDEAVISRLSDEDYPYIYAVLTDLSNALIAEKYGISEQTVKRRFTKVCEKLGISTKKELKEYIYNYL